MAALRRAYLQARDFLLSNRSREFLVFMGFFLIAAAFWILQTLNDEYETDLTLPLRLRDVPAEMVITSEPPQQLRIRVKDKGTVLLNYKLGNGLNAVQLAFEQHDDGGKASVPAHVLDQQVTNQLNASTRLLSIKPDTIEYYYASGTARRVPVKLVGRVSAAREYYLADTIISPDSVLIYAPRNIIDTIKAAYTQVMDLTDIADTLRQTVSLRTARGIKPVPSEVEVVLPVDMYTEMTIEVPVEGTGFPANKTLRTFPSKVKVTFMVGLSRLRSIHTEDFRIVIPYEDVRNADTEKYAVSLESLPHDVRQVSYSPEQVDFLIEQNSPLADEP